MSGAPGEKGLLDAARAYGFDAAALTDASPTEPVPPGAHPQALKLTADPREIMPGARSVLVLALGYRPYEAGEGGAAVDAYYVRSNEAHAMARAFADELGARGVRAAFTSSLRAKPLAIRSGLGRLGRNALVSVGSWGTRVSLQTVVTDVPCAPPAPGRPGLDDMCAGCGLCVRACPAKALPGDGSLLLDRCLRAQDGSLPLPESMRSMTGGSILGCDLCQRCCPRCAAVPPEPVPDALREDLRLERLLAGDYKDLKAWLGANNARRLRLMSAAALAAANAGRLDLIDALKRLAGEPTPLGEHAAWAAERLTSLRDGKNGNI